MTSKPCRHYRSIPRSFAGMRLLRVAAESLVYHCDRCDAGVRVARCVASTRFGARCRHPARPLHETCAVHADRTVAS